MKYMMNSVITVLYFNGRIYEENDGVIFEGTKKAIQIKCGIRKYVALQICDDEDVETMIESFQQQEQMSVLELYIEKDVAGGSMFHSANFVTSCGNNLFNNESEPPRNVNDEVTNMIQPVTIVHPTEGVEGIQNPFLNDALHYNNIN
ncbi:hypothetical protein HKD37_11G031709 [Glycine soja]